MNKRVSGDSFSGRVVRLALSIPPGKVTTYGRLARAAGGGGMAARSVTSILAKADVLLRTTHGQAEGKNIPFHRIVYADGRVWLDERHRVSRMKLYKKEGIVVDARGRIADFIDTLYEFH